MAALQMGKQFNSVEGKVDSGSRRNTGSPDLAHLGSTVPGLGGPLPANSAYPCFRRKSLVPEPRQGSRTGRARALDSAKRIQARAKARSLCNCHHHHQILGLRLHSLPASRAAPAVLSPGPFPRRRPAAKTPQPGSGSRSLRGSHGIRLNTRCLSVAPVLRKLQRNTTIHGGPIGPGPSKLQPDPWTAGPCSACWPAQCISRLTAAQTRAWSFDEFQPHQPSIFPESPVPSGWQSIHSFPSRSSKVCLSLWL